MRKISFDETIQTTDLLMKLMGRMCNETIPNRFLALYDLTQKIRACLAVISAINEYGVLCVPTNLMYRSIITDLLTSLLITEIDDTQFKEAMSLMDYAFAKSLQKFIKVQTLVRKEVHPEDASTYDAEGLKYQSLYYDHFEDLIESSKGKEWSFKKKPCMFINGVKFDGTIDSIYNVLLTCPRTRAIASVYGYYRLFSQSEHFSLKNRFFIYKQDLHDVYYNKTRGFLCLGEQYIYNKYSSPN